MRCLECQYDLIALAKLGRHRCPECGRAFDSNDPRTFAPANPQKTGGGWRSTLVVSGLIASVGFMSFWLMAYAGDRRMAFAVVLFFAVFFGLPVLVLLAALVVGGQGVAGLLRRKKCRDDDWERDAGRRD